MRPHDDRVSIGRLVRRYWPQISLTWGLTIVETILLASLPLLVGWSIDGLLTDNWTAFQGLLGAMGALLLIAVTRRLYDTRVYGTMRVALGRSVVAKANGGPVSKTTARLDMSRELVDFLENEAPMVLTAFIHLILSVIVLFSFHSLLAFAAISAAIASLSVYGIASRYFYRVNGDLNAQTEKQVQVLERGVAQALHTHLFALWHHEVKLSDAEAIVYGLIFAVLMLMLGFNLWFSTTQFGASTGQIFSIVTYSYEFMESAVTVPIVLQSLTRVSEITVRINGSLERVRG